MKTQLVKNTNTPLGYELHVINDDGEVQVLSITEYDKNNPKVLKLPENPSNRKWITPKGDDVQELEYKATKVLGPKSSSTTKSTASAPTKQWYEYLSNEDKAEALKLIDKAAKLKKVADIKAQKAALEALLEELEKSEEDKD